MSVAPPTISAVDAMKELSAAATVGRTPAAAIELTPAQRRTLEGLIGNGVRPVFAPELAQRLRDRIEEAVRTAELERPLWVG